MNAIIARGIPMNEIAVVIISIGSVVAYLALIYVVKRYDLLG
jgi:hypothetical protein